MELFRQMVGATFAYSEKIEEVVPHVKEYLMNNLGIELKPEGFVCAAWSHQLGITGTYFVVVNEKMVIVRKQNEISQTAFQDIISINKSLMKDTVLVTSGSKNDLFFAGVMPKKKLLDLMFKKINIQWNKVKMN